MKSILTLCVLLLCLCVSPRLCAQEWTQLASPTQRHLRDVYMHSPTLGWVVGDSGTLLKTTDGVSWSVLGSPTNNDLISVAFFDTQRGYLLPRFGPPYYTTDGGSSWQMDSLLLNACYGKRVRTSGNLVYLVADGCFGGTWIYTRDVVTGDTTEMFNYFGGPQQAPSLNDVGFPNGTSAIGMGWNNAIFRTSDSGDTWSFTAAPDTLLDWQSVVFAPDGTGYAVTQDLFWPLYKSLDGGATWVMDSTWMATFFYPLMTDLDFPQAGYGYICGGVNWSSQGLVTCSRNGGFTYETVPQRANAIDFATDSIGFMVGDSGMIMKRLGLALSAGEGNEGLAFSVAPNPSGGAAMVKWAGNGRGRLTVVGMDGHVVMDREVAGGEGNVVLRVPAAGMYVVRLEVDGKVRMKRWVVRE